MSYNFTQRLSRLNTRFGELNPETVTYIRGDEEQELVVNPVLEETQEVSPGAAVTKVEVQRFGYNLADILFDDPLPKLDDRIVRVDGRTYAPSGRPHFRYTTNLKTRIVLTTSMVNII